jgi:hypothetical protein
MNYTQLFYWLTVADNAKYFFGTMITIFTLISLISTIGYLANTKPEEVEAQRMSRKWMWWSYPFCILFWLLQIATPSKKDALLIVAGGETLNFLTTDSTARQIPHELTNFVVTELKNMASDAKVELNINNQKEKILNEARNMSTSELMGKMKSDTTFANIILNN